MAMRGGFNQRLASGEEEDFSLRQLDRKTLAHLSGYLRPHLLALILAIGAMLLVTASILAQPYLIKVAIDDYILMGNRSGLNRIVILYLALQGVFWFFSYWQSYLSNQVGQQVIFRLRSDLFRKLLSFPMQFYDNAKVGQVTARITHDTGAISNLMSTGIVNFVNDILTLVGIAAIMLWLHPLLAGITFITIPAVLLTMWYLGKQLRLAYRDVRAKAADLTAEVEEGMAGIRVIQSLAQESTSVGRFAKHNLSNLKANLRAVFVFAMVFPAMSVLGAVGSALVLTFGGWLVIQDTVTLGVLMAFLSYVSRFFGPLRELSQVYNTFQAAGAGIERVFEYLNTTPALTETNQPQRPENGFQGQIEFDAVTFAYDERETVLSDFDLHVTSGETLAIVGPSGAGKSTIARLIARLYDVQAGAVTIDGIDVRKLSFGDLRRVVGLIPQQVFLFDGTLKDNIAYAKPSASSEEIEQAIKAVHADQVIQGLPQGLDTPVGEAGVKLSGGQKQLIAFARALLINPKIVILDEATSSVDAYTEALIQKGMDRLLQGRTCIIIAHRFSTVIKADRICVLEEGRIIDSGSHTELIERCAAYQNLYANQLQKGA